MSRTNLTYFLTVSKGGSAKCVAKIMCFSFVISLGVTFLANLSSNGKITDDMVIVVFLGTLLCFFAGGKYCDSRHPLVYKFTAFTEILAHGVLFSVLTNVKVSHVQRKIRLEHT